VRVGQTVHAAYLSQEVTELPDDLRVIEAVKEVHGEELGSMQLTEHFGFPNSRQWTPVVDLSGGERRRLQLLRLLLTGPNVLLLDEPTNDLDIDTLAELEDLLDSWPGTLVLVSHDRYLIERVCDSTVALLGDGSLAALPGGVDEYLARRAAATTPSEKAGPRKADPRAARRELTRLERRIASLETREAELHAELAQHATDYEHLSALDAELRQVVAQREAAEQAWLDLAEG
jgi:ATP-binding cassette subfamily F protein uup